MLAILKIKTYNPENKILLIYNHGQSTHDGPSNDCVWKGGMKTWHL